jgi:glucuronoarabinoxylan endo-1,4-beta-xylanase
MRYRHIFAVLAGLILISGVMPLSAAVTVNWTNVHQPIDGFGAANIYCAVLGSSGAYNMCNFTDAQADLFFSPTSGVGLSLLRTEVDRRGGCLTTCAFPDLVTMQKAVARGARIFAEPMNPPVSMITNGSFLCGGTYGYATLDPADYGIFATYIKNYVMQLTAR